VCLLLKVLRYGIFPIINLSIYENLFISKKFNMYSYFWKNRCGLDVDIYPQHMHGRHRI
jgi:hypothetical protein